MKHSVLNAVVSAYFLVSPSLKPGPDYQNPSAFIVVLNPHPNPQHLYRGEEDNDEDEEGGVGDAVDAEGAAGAAEQPVHGAAAPPTGLGHLFRIAAVLIFVEEEEGVFCPSEAHRCEFQFEPSESFVRCFVWTDFHFKIGKKQYLTLFTDHFFSKRVASLSVSISLLLAAQNRSSFILPLTMSRQLT